MLDEIPKPEILDADRVDRDDREELTNEDRRSQSQLLAKALGETSDYAQQLWQQLDAVRAYLLDSLPDDPRLPGPHRTGGARPTGPDDEEGWARWIDVFADTTSVLCGAHGDSGYGRSQATVEAQFRRAAGDGSDAASDVPARGAGSDAAAPTAMPPAPTSAPTSAPAAAAPVPAADDLPAGPGLAPLASLPPKGRGVARAIGAAAVGVLALRGVQTLPLRRRSKVPGRSKAAVTRRR